MRKSSKESVAALENKGGYDNEKEILKNGDLTMYLPENTGFTLDVEKLNGAFESDFETVKQGNSYVYGNGLIEYDIETVSGNVAVKKLS